MDQSANKTLLVQEEALVHAEIMSHVKGKVLRVHSFC